MGYQDDPDAQRPSTPSSPSPSTPGPSRNQSSPNPGPNDPDNQAPWSNDVDSLDYVGSDYYPGYSPRQTTADGSHIGLQEYKGWLANNRTKGWWQALEKQYGSQFVAFMWHGYVTGMDSAKLWNEVGVRFPGYENYINGGGGGGGGGYGGGGGVSRAEQIASAAAAIKDQAMTLGLDIDDGGILALAKRAVDENWSSAQLTDELLIDPTKLNKPGTYSQTIDYIKQLGKSQLINVSDDTAAQWAQRIVSNEMSIDTVRSVLAQQAQGEWGWATEGLKTGATMSDLLAPARDQIAAELELTPGSVDLMDERFRKMVQTTDAQGTARAATLTEVTQAARKDSQWANTAGAARRAASVATMIRKVFEGN